ncbi:MAG: amino acid adenylation domain-containing protein [Anaerolineales bacterium]|nr:amino acid adenylation domain-containing protein [Anaerolineales bacterium]
MQQALVTEKILIELNQIGISMSVAGDKLRLHGQTKRLPMALRQQIQNHKPEIIDYLTQLQQAPQAVSEVIRPRQAGGPAPLSFAQQRLWTFSQLDPDSTAYNLQSTLHFAGELDVAALERAVGCLIERHETLRTTFGLRGNEPVQVVHDASPFRLPIHAVANAEEAQLHTHTIASEPFDLSNGPLLRVQLLQISPTDHWLVIAMHHIISDGWSIGIFRSELAQAYRAYAGGETPTLRGLPIQYADYASWQRQYLRDERLEHHLSFWKRKLAGTSPPPALLEMPTDRPRPPVQSHHGAIYPFTLDRDITNRLEQLSQKHQVTMFMVMLAAYYVLLARYSGQTDIVVGTGLAGRTRTEIEGVIGFFVNILALRTQLDSNPPFTRLLEQVRQDMLAAHDHQDVSFDQMLNALQIERNTSYNPLFQTTFSMQSGGGGSIDWPGLEVTAKSADLAVAKFDFSLDLRHTPNDVFGYFEYNTDLFDESTMARMVEHYAALLRSIIAHPDHPVLNLPMLTATEEQQIVEEWNKTAVNLGEPQPIHALFEAQVERTPDAVALVLDKEQLTYRELNGRSNQLAHHLQQAGVGVGTAVGICLKRDFDLIVATLAIIKAGGAYVPLDPAYPPERLAFMSDDTGLVLILTEDELSENLPTTVPLVNIHNIDVSTYPDTNLAVAVGGDDLLYLMYTSGSTGQPKGIEILHHNVQRLVRQTNYAQLDASQTFLQLASPSFDAATFEIWGSLCNGATLVLYPELEIDLQRLADVIKEHNISTMFLTTALFHQMVDYNLDGLRPIKQLLVGGEVTSTQHVRRAIEALYPQTTYIACYGPTENTTFTTTTPLTDPASVQGSVPIGVPIANTQVYILDDALELSPVGVPGELYTGGLGVARGYRNRPNLTAERFIEHPRFGRLYKTGDLCRWRPNADGSPNIEFMGRADFQVKLHGFRIELGEIENALLAHPAVSEAVVLLREDNPGDKRLVAYVVADLAEETPAIAELLAHYLGQHLPDYMIPATFVQLEAMPLTVSGKLNRSALPAPDFAGAQDEFVAPRNPLETALAQVFTEVLHVPEMGIHENFFRMGGDSILSIQVVGRLMQQGYKLTTKELFQHPTIASLANVIEQRCDDATSQVVASQEPQRGNAPLLPIEQWYFDAKQPDLHHFNQSALLRLKKPLQPAMLETAVSKLLHHHDALRFQYTQSESGWQQTYLEPTEAIPLELVDLRAVAVAERTTHIKAICAKTQVSLNPCTGDLLRVVYFHGGTEERLLLVVHHLAVDGVSWRILLEDLITLLSGGQLAPKTSSYRDWGETLQTATAQGHFDAKLNDWLSECTALPLPLDEPQAVNTLGTSHRLQFALSQAETDHLLRTLPDRYDVTLDAVVLTALTETLADWSGNDGLRVKFESHGRQQLFDTVNLNRTVGWFTSAYPVTMPRVAGTAVSRIQNTLQQMQRVTDGGISFGALSYLHPDDNIRAAFANLPTAPVIYNYFGQVDRFDHHFFELAPEFAGQAISPNFQRDTVLDSNASVAKGQLRIAWTVSPQLRRETAEWLLENFSQRLRSLIVEAVNDDTATIRREQADSDSWFVTLQGEGARPPLFCFYPITGTISQFGNLIPYLSRKQPIYALQARGIYDELPPFGSIEALAADTIRAMKKIQPAGPYNLLGWSFGGRVAYEIAQQLQANGENVSLLGILDEYPDSNAPNPNGTVSAYLLAHFTDSLGLNRAVAYKQLVALGRQALEQHNETPIAALCRLLAAEGYTFPFEPAQVERIFHTYFNHMEIFHAYQLKPYDGSIVVYAAEGSKTAVKGIERWQTLVSDTVEHVTVPGTHHTLLNPEHVEKLATALEEQLQPAYALLEKR